jgi:hypothetical protein
VNGDYGDGQCGQRKAWGVATGGRYAVTGVARGFAPRRVRGGQRLLGFCSLPNSDFNGGVDYCYSMVDGYEDYAVETDVKIFGITATVDHLLTDQLMVRGEVRWDNVRHSDNTSNGEFFSGSLDSSESDLGLKSNQVTLGAEVVYNFNKFGGE